jgi:hypothetical protein
MMQQIQYDQGLFSKRIPECELRGHFVALFLCRHHRSVHCLLSICPAQKSRVIASLLSLELGQSFTTSEAPPNATKILSK